MENSSAKGRGPARSKGNLPAEVGGYVVSIFKKVRRLHYLGACHMVPGVDYKDYEELGMDRPSPSEYTTYCKKCWGSKGLDPEDDAEVPTGSDPEVMQEEGGF